MITAPPRAVEIACDESGYEGDKLIGTTTDVFAHASVRLETAAAAACMQQLRDRIRSPALEYKANHVLREKHRAVLTWLLAPTGPVYGNARVYLVDKEFFVVARVVAGFDPARPELAAVLYREGRHVFGPERWRAFLAACHDGGSPRCCGRTWTRPRAGATAAAAGCSGSRISRRTGCRAPR